MNIHKSKGLESSVVIVINMIDDVLGFPSQMKSEDLFRYLNDNKDKNKEMIIENDYKTIAKKVMSGKAEELSESDTFYLGACTKGATAETSIVSQYYPPHTPAKKRAFCYKNSYMTFVLNKYVVTEHEEYERIIRSSAELQNQTLSEIIVSKIRAHIGKSDKELCSHFSREYNNNKAQWTDLTYRMLGIRSNRASPRRPRKTPARACGSCHRHPLR